MSHLVSVIVRTKNRPKLLGEALESLSAQTYSPIEVIIVNDGGIDVTHVVMSFIKRFHKLELITHPSPQGRPQAANTGLKHASGDFIAFLDDDDLFLPHHIETLVSKASKNLIVYSRCKQQIWCQGKLETEISPWEGDFSLDLLRFGNFIPFISLLFPKEVIEKVGFFDERLELFEDWDYLLRASRHFDFLAIDEITCVYRIFKNGSSISALLHGTEAEKQFFITVLEKNLPDIKLETIYRNYLHRSALRFELSLLQNTILSKETTIKVLKNKLNHKETLLQEKTKELEETIKALELMRKEVEELKIALQNRERLLNEITSTLGWKLLIKLRHVIDSLAPQNTSRRKLLELNKLILKLLLVEPNGKEMIKYQASKFIHYSRTYGLKAAIHKALSKASVQQEEYSPPGEALDVTEVLNKLLDTGEPDIKVLYSHPVTVVIPVYNAFEKFKKCIESVIKNTDLRKIHLLVIDDASTDPRVWELISDLSKKHNFEAIRHNSNQGFVRTVNEAIRKRKGHLVVLNSDTEVPKGWLERLLYPIWQNPEKIASCTPFSNSGATICSFPNICRDSNLPLGLNCQEIDSVFRTLFPKTDPIEIPTGVGFCMAMSDEALKTVGEFDEESFGRGYGEENDWCLRARKKGFSNILVPWLFVAHYHGSSFGPEKEKLVIDAVRKVEEKHPGYTRKVEEFIRKDPPKKIRSLLWQMLKKKSSNKEALVLTHNLIGGSLKFLSDLTEKTKIEPWIVKSTGEKIILEAENIYGKIESKPERLKSLIEFINPPSILVNHLIDFDPIEDFIQILAEVPIKKVVVLHDYLSICPSYTLTDYKGSFCNVPENIEYCQKCLSHELASRGINPPKTKRPIKDIVSWRDMWNKLLQNNTAVVAPSKTAADIFKKAYPTSKVEVIEHIVNLPATDVPPYTQNEDKLVVGIIGALNKPKGADLVYNLAKEAERKKLPIEFVIIGYTYKHSSYNSAKLKITGPYDRKNLGKLISTYKPQVILIPSLWPETYSYTVSEAIKLGIPLIVFDLGAQAERVRKTKGGIIVKCCSKEALLEKLVELSRNRNLLEEYKSNLKNFKEPDPKKWAQKWLKIIYS